MSGFGTQKNKLGWNQINIEGEDPYIYLPLGLIRKEGLPTRKIPIRAGFLKMLKEFKKGGEKKISSIRCQKLEESLCICEKKNLGKEINNLIEEG